MSSRIIQAYLANLEDSNPKLTRIMAAVVELLDAIADYTETGLDDWIVDRLKACGLDDDTVDNFMKPERIQED